LLNKYFANNSAIAVVIWCQNCISVSCNWACKWASSQNDKMKTVHY